MDTDPAMVNYLLSSSEGKAGIVSIWEWNMSHRQMAKTSIAGIASQRTAARKALRGRGPPLDAKSKTACCCTFHLEIVHAWNGEEFFDGRLEFAVRNKFLRQQAPAPRISF